jgi:hypothetical protein
LITVGQQSSSLELRGTLRRKEIFYLLIPLMRLSVLAGVLGMKGRAVERALPALGELLAASEFALRLD